MIDANTDSLITNTLPIHSMSSNYMSESSQAINADNYYRNFQYGQNQNTPASFQSHPFHQPAYSWLNQAALSSQEKSQAESNNSTWSPHRQFNQVSANTATYPYLQSLNLTNLSSTSTSVSSSNVSSTATTPILGSKIHSVNSQVIKTPPINNDSDVYHSTPANNFDPRIHSHLVNAYQSYTSNLHSGYPYQNNTNGYFYPATPPKDHSAHENQNNKMNLKNDLITPESDRDSKRIKLEIDQDSVKKQKNIGDDMKDSSCFQNTTSADEDSDSDEMDNSLEEGEEENSISPIRNFNNEQYFEQNHLDNNKDLKWSPNSKNTNKSKKALPGNYYFIK